MYSCSGQNLDGRLGSSSFFFSALTHPVSISKYIRSYHAISWSLPWHKPLPSLASCIGHACLSLLPTQQPKGWKQMWLCSVPSVSSPLCHLMFPLAPATWASSLSHGVSLLTCSLSPAVPLLGTPFLQVSPRLTLTCPRSLLRHSLL